jgi:hypothetical protein
MNALVGWPRQLSCVKPWVRDLDTTVTQPDEVATGYREALSKLS